MHRFLPVLFALFVSTSANALTPDELRAMIDERAAASDPFQDLLNDPNPARSLAAMELMIASGEPHLVQIAVDFGLLSALPEIRRAAINGFLLTRPVLLVKLDVSENKDPNFERYFRAASDGTVLEDGTATYSLNVGAFDAEQNCFVRTGSKYCAVEIGPVGVSLFKRHASRSDYFLRSDLFFNADGTLSGATSVNDVKGGLPTTLRTMN